MKYFKETTSPYLSKEKLKHRVFPEASLTFRAFKECPFDQTNIVILGQDPYHDFGSATGLCFDNKFGAAKISPSLRNLLNEMAFDSGSYSDDLDLVEKSGSYLGHLPKQGVLLLNTALTVAEQSPASHLNIWAPFTQKVIEALNKKEKLIWILWGAKAQAFIPQINPKHYKILSSHPSPLSATKECGNTPPFKGSKPFSAANIILEKLNLPLVNW